MLKLPIATWIKPLNHPELPKFADGEVISNAWSSFNTRSLFYKANPSKGKHELIGVIYKHKNPKNFTHVIWNFCDEKLSWIDLRDIQKNEMHHVPHGMFDVLSLKWHESIALYDNFKEMKISIKSKDQKQCD